MSPYDKIYSLLVEVRGERRKDLGRREAITNYIAARKKEEAWKKRVTRGGAPDYVKKRWHGKEERKGGERRKGGMYGSMPTKKIHSHKLRKKIIKKQVQKVLKDYTKQGGEYKSSDELHGKGK
jgi:hypothetical protein